MRKFLLPKEKELFDNFLESENMLFVATNPPAPEMRIAFTEAVEPATEAETIHPFTYAAQDNRLCAWKPYQFTVRDFEEQTNTDGVLHLRQAFLRAQEKTGNPLLRKAANLAIEHCNRVLERLPESHKMK